MSKRHITLRIDEGLMKRVDSLLTKYPRLGLSDIIETAVSSLFSLNRHDIENILSKYLLEGFKKPKEDDT